MLRTALLNRTSPTDLAAPEMGTWSCHVCCDESTTPSDMTIDYKVSSFQINLSSGFENKLLPNDLIIARNHGDDEEDIGEEFGGVVDLQGQPSRVGGPIQVEFESASESRSSPH